MVAHLERPVAEPAVLDPEYGARVAQGTVGVRLPVSRCVCKRKLSQNKDVATRRRVIEALRQPGPYGDPELAAEMAEELGPESGE
jgi:transcriptional regulator